LRATRSTLREEKKLSIAALSQTLPDRLKLHVTPCSAISRWNASLSAPTSAWRMALVVSHP
jgi:hypothetical protein